MLSIRPEMPQHLILAIEHHRELVESAQRRREAIAARRAMLEPPMRWRRVRSFVGDLLIYFGQRIKADATTTVSNSVSGTVWG